uniref:Spt4/RpoE2 zinc finger domain-containing protein n=1 Tax=Compsopogon caeruleus TaxID=31354 RepID=A0A7S1TIX5_9RHOD|mmetsp:Transcript_9287/g.18942  ORF Transcript_9287/g.18942 Transcript_9287/m.18942 type:complete len:120 (+) Transcript_9287:109-468(+)
MDDYDSTTPTETSLNKLRACMNCSLVKSAHQFSIRGCENCPFLGLENDRERIQLCTTPNFSGLFSVMRPLESWVAKWQRIVKLRSGCYALSVEGELPEDIIEEMLENGGKAHRVRATSR